MSEKVVVNAFYLLKVGDLLLFIKNNLKITKDQPYTIFIPCYNTSRKSFKFEMFTDLYFCHKFPVY